MKNLSYSFKPNGHFFVFDLDTGKTIPTKYPLKTPRAARKAWLTLRGR
jgi:hypothetical protein